MTAASTQLQPLLRQNREKPAPNHRSAEPSATGMDGLLPTDAKQTLSGGTGRLAQTTAALPVVAASQTSSRPNGYAASARRSGRAGMALGAPRARPVVECRCQPYERGLPETLLRRLGAGFVAGCPATPPALFMNRRMRNRTYGGGGGRRR